MTASDAETVETTMYTWYRVSGAECWRSVDGTFRRAICTIQNHQEESTVDALRITASKAVRLGSIKHTRHGCGRTAVYAGMF